MVKRRSVVGTNRIRKWGEKTEAARRLHLFPRLSLWKTRKANKKEGEWDIAGKLSDIARPGHDIIAEAWRNTSEHRQVSGRPVVSREMGRNGEKMGTRSRGREGGERNGGRERR